ncbi:MAG: sensor histidine kinase [Gemmatimonadales bacterium]
MVLSFRQRILLILVALGTVPAAAAILGWALTLRANDPAPVARAAVQGVATTGRDLVETLDTLRLRSAEREALNAHVAQMNEALIRVRQASVYTRLMSGGLALTLLLFGAIILYVSIRLGGHLSRQLSRPMEELIGWTDHILRHEPLPPDRPRRGAPEFEDLRRAIREMAASLEQGRARELEAERLRMFREVARRVAHEMKNPLTPIRFAVAHLQRDATPQQQEVLEILRTESARLEQMAREFTDFGRLPEGPPSEIDLRELLEEVLRNSLPDGMQGRVDARPGTERVTGHYDPLRRAFENLVRNAVEACEEQGALDVRISPSGDTGVTVVIADHGPGIEPGEAGRIFEPYYTRKPEGTGLGLALVRQAVEVHGGRISVGPTPGGGATFTVELPA